MKKSYQYIKEVALKYHCRIDYAQNIVEIEFMKLIFSLFLQTLIKYLLCA